RALARPRLRRAGLLLPCGPVVCPRPPPRAPALRPARGRDGLAPVQPRGRRLPARRPALPSLPIIPQSADARATRRGPGPLTALGFRTKNDETASPGTDRPALPPQEPPMPRPTSPQALDQPRPDGARPLQAGPLAIVGGCGHVGLPLGLAF